MNEYIHKVQYYETDKMQITHHSNYIRWMEEARVDFLENIGWGYEKLEQHGIYSPVIGINCEYKNSTRFNEKIVIHIKIKEYRGVRLVIQYEMKSLDTGKIVLIGESEHCFINKEGKPIILKKQFPELDKVLYSLK